MGIKSTAKGILKIKPLSCKAVFELNIGNKVDVDGNALALTLNPKRKGDLNKMATTITHFLIKLSSTDFVVTIVFDSFTSRCDNDGSDWETYRCVTGKEEW